MVCVLVHGLPLLLGCHGPRDINPMSFLCHLETGNHYSLKDLRQMVHDHRCEEHPARLRAEQVLSAIETLPYQLPSKINPGVPPALMPTGQSPHGCLPPRTLPFLPYTPTCCLLNFSAFPPNIHSLPPPESPEHSTEAQSQCLGLSSEGGQSCSSERAQNDFKDSASSVAMAP